MKGDFITRPHDWTRVQRTHQSAADYACAIERRITEGQQRASAGAWLVVDVATAIGLVVIIAWVIAQWGN